MIKYSVGWSQRAQLAWYRVNFLAKRSWGAWRNYPVFRAPHNHSVYAADNRRLSTTTLERARIVHRVSSSSRQTRPAVIEFEHPFALVGGIDEHDDFPLWRASVGERFRALVEWLDPERFRLVATSAGAGDRAAALLRSHGMAQPDRIITTLPWSGEIKRRSIPRLRGTLHVFHYGGTFPAAKGTLDVLRVARLLPQVRFHVSVALGHPRLPRGTPDNVEVTSLYSRAAYLEALRRSHVLLYPIYGDGWGVVLDALAHAMPIVLYDSYDKSEAIEDGGSGALIPLPRELSFYDSFLTGSYKNWPEFEEFIASSGDDARTVRLTTALESYARDEELLMEHSRGAARLFRRKHDPDDRVQKLRELYRELLGSLDRAGLGSA